MSRRIRSALVAIAWVCLTLPEILTAQISPGPLSQPHAQVEGNSGCLQCHSQKKRVSPDLCLECHAILGERIENRQGYHATLGDQGCEKCHMEHNGREFELVWWGDQGQKSFDHEGTGYLLEGAHRNLDCRQCHRATFVANQDRFRKQGKNLERTFLGLDASACSACHQDPHRGQFAPRRCEECHGTQTWKETLGFQHQETRFSLLGQHQKVECDKCHPRSAPVGTRDSAGAQMQFSGLRFANCSDCHQDPHAGRLGAQCQRCHSEQSWRSVELGGFDHRRARFALEGAHQRVQCAKCHGTATAYRVARFEACADCHRDPHAGQFAQRADGGVCTACHDLEAFSPSNFTLEAHQKSEYPLEASHLAVPCDACHQRVSASEIALVAGNQLAASDSRGRQTMARFRFPSTLCSECHPDPHQRSVDPFMATSGCTECHELGGWKRVRFDHEKTDYSLEVGHQKPGCRECHQADAALKLPIDLLFGEVSKECTACHADPHAGQFSNRMAPEFCRDCHSLTTWKQTVFDHNQDARYALDGQHASVACRACHPTEQSGKADMVRYRPLAMTCADCHSGTPFSGRTARFR